MPINTVVFIPYKNGSRGLRNLINAFPSHAYEVKLEGSRYRHKPNKHLLVNWGNSHLNTLSQYASPEVILNATGLATVTNKLNFFTEMLHLEICPPFWNRRYLESLDDIPEDAYPIVCRTVLNGHSGQGIVIAMTREELVDCPLYVQYIKKKDEYRIHIGLVEDKDLLEDTPQLIACQKKARRLDIENPNWKVRNHDNGFVYIHVEPETIPQDVLKKAFTCFENLPLDFGAIDVIYNEKQDRAYVLEVNSAPGLEGTTVEKYVNFFQQKLQEYNNET